MLVSVLFGLLFLGVSVWACVKMLDLIFDGVDITHLEVEDVADSGD